MDTKFKQLQKELRENMPLPEVILWQVIRGKQLGVKFRRQYTIGNRILDFYSPIIKLGIEIDGDSHFLDEKSREREIEKDRELEKHYGIKVLRFLNPEIMRNLEEVVQVILKEIEKRRTLFKSFPSLRKRKCHPPS